MTEKNFPYDQEQDNNAHIHHSHSTVHRNTSHRYQTTKINQLKNENTLERRCKTTHNDMILYREKEVVLKADSKLHTTLN